MSGYQSIKLRLNWLAAILLFAALTRGAVWVFGWREDVPCSVALPAMFFGYSVFAANEAYRVTKEQMQL